MATGKTGNDLTRNFLLTFTGAREITGLTISADVWQLDFTVRLKGMDERTRLANFDLYGQGYFEGDGWLLRASGGNYAFSPGLGYVGGVRARLDEVLPLAVSDRPRDVYLTVCLRPVGSDRVAEVSAMLVNVGVNVPDAKDETGLMHYRQIVARIEANATVTDLRPKRMGGLPPDKIGAAESALEIIAGPGISGGGTLTGDISLAAEYLWNAKKNYGVPSLVFGLDGKMYTALSPSGPMVAGVGAKQPGLKGNEAYWLDYADSLFSQMMDYKIGKYEFFEDELDRPGWKPCLGGVISNFSKTYPKAAQYFQTLHGQKRLVTQAQYDALHVATWHTNADGTKVGWNGIGGVNKFVWDKAADTLRLPDLAGMGPEQIGSDALGVGGGHGDGVRNITGLVHGGYPNGWIQWDTTSGACYATSPGTVQNAATNAYGQANLALGFDARRVVPTAAKNQPRAWGALACVYLGKPSS